MTSQETSGRLVVAKRYCADNAEDLTSAYEMRKARKTAFEKVREPGRGRNS